MITDSTEVLVAFGNNLRREREKAGLSQPQLAARCDVLQREISLIENGRYSPGILVMVDLARGLGILPEELLSGIK